MRLLLSGGGTGGHVYPALTVAAAIRKRAGANPAARSGMLYVGRAESIEARLAERAGIPFRAIATGQIRGQRPWTIARNLWRMYTSIGVVRALIREFQPNAIFVTGGYVSAPVIWAGAAEQVSSVIYLPDLEPGWAIRATARYATRVAVTFPEVERYFAHSKAVTTGYPVREAFFQIEQKSARVKLGLDAHTPTVAIFGGSSGAHHINQAVVANLPALAQLAQVIHLTGRADESWVSAQVAQLPNALRNRVRVFGYLDEELPAALGAADVVVARAGAATLGEFPALGVPAILVPGPYAGLHQERNADFLVTRGAAYKIKDAALKDELLPMLKQLFAMPEKLNTMRDAMRALAQPRAADNIADLLDQVTSHAFRFTLSGVVS